MRRTVTTFQSQNLYLLFGSSYRHKSVDFSEAGARRFFIVQRIPFARTRFALARAGGARNGVFPLAGHFLQQLTNQMEETNQKPEGLRGIADATLFPSFRHHVLWFDLFQGLRGGGKGEKGDILTTAVPGKLVCLVSSGKPASPAYHSPPT
uniref:Uncharacterized protein n=1 Tax=Chromera velia CCMP2878 TaxID=1169474 RepID=A0A0G4HJE6_9ALVE|eukprot:Cvel_7083.t1-p1 / transcript=Cvel_7083.t1 / gene=Cvel_7083 / organism=Chromera_velia_CCMP2878 / gene_product=hypothetical protein / transcript_product=hypothetical protein / location=Cvel_scaffold362:41953-42856(+) / protein_length=150 / sequence_SO=supercontig / SO=protein_coding / is_pseudo=false